MAQNKLDIEVSLIDKYTAGLEKIKGSVKSMEGTFKGMATAGAAGFAALSLAVNSSIKAATEAETSQARLAHILKTATDASDAQIAALIEQSGELQRLGVVSEDVTQAAQGTLATFDLQSESIQALIPAFLDMMVAEKGVNATTDDAIGLANGLGKVLQGQVGALSKQGFIFDENTEKILKNGTELEKVNALSEILSSTYGGLNQQLRKTTEGGMAGLNMQIGEVQEAIGNALIPEVQKLTATLTPLMEELTAWIQANPGLTKTIVAVAFALTGFLTVVGTLGLAIPVVITGLQAMGVAMGVLSGPIGWLILAIAGIATYMIATGTTWEDILLGMRTAFLESWMFIQKGLNELELMWVSVMNTIGRVTDEEMIGVVKRQQSEMTRLNTEFAELGNEYTKLNKEKYESARLAAEDEVGRQRDMVDLLTGDAKEKARANLDAMKKDYLEKYPEMRLGSTAELQKMRQAADEESKKAANAAIGNLKEMVSSTKSSFSEQTNAAIEWGKHLITNFASGVMAGIPALTAAVGVAKLVMNTIHQSYNPELPAQLWGEHFILNFTAGLELQKPALVASLSGLVDVTKNFRVGVEGEMTTLNETLEGYKTKVDETKKSHQELKDEGITSIQNLNIGIGKEIDSMTTKLQELESQLADIFGDYESESAANRQNLAQAVVDSEERQKDLREQMLNEEDFAKRALLQRQLEDEMIAVRNHKDLLAQVESEVTEIKRFNGLTRLEQAIEMFSAEQTKIEETKNERLESYQADLEKAQEVFPELEKMWTDRNEKVLKFLGDEIDKNNSFVTSINSSITQVSILIEKLKQLRLEQSGGGTFGGLKGARANGGPVLANSSYLVGERGPEILTMGGRPGYVTPNHQLGGGGSVINLTISGYFDKRGLEKALDEVVIGKLRKNLIPI